MNRKIILIGGFVLILVVSLITREIHKGEVTYTQDFTYLPPGVSTYSNSNGEVVTLSVASTTELSGLGYNDLTLYQVATSSGSEFIDESNIVKAQVVDDSLSLYTNNSKIFTGVKSSSSTTTQVAIEERPQEVDTRAELINYTWVLTEATTIPEQKLADFKLTFSTDGTVNGSTDCNSFFGTYAVDGNSMSVGGLGSTQMYCENSFESNYLALLSQSKTFLVASGTRLIIGTDSTPLIYTAHLETN